VGGCAKATKSVTPLFPGASTRVPGAQVPAEFGGVETGRRSFFGPESRSGEELWVVARNRRAAEPQEETPGTGALVLAGQEKPIPLPLKHTEVRARISGYISSVEVIQQFSNPYSSKIEAVYVFPLPHDAAVNEFIMVIGARRIRGIIREREEAEQIYQEAKRQGYVASLLTEERPNIFTQSVANIEPGKEIDVTIRYFHTLRFVDGWFEFVFPMVVGPRFNPPGSTEGIGAVARGQRSVSGQRTEVHYLKPGERSGHDIAVRIEVEAGLPIEEFECRTHQLVRESRSSSALTLVLDELDRIPNRDLVLRYRVAGDQIKSGLLTHADEHGGYFTLMLYPPRELATLKRQALELVFVLDCSGSMSGRPIEQAKAAIERALHLLQPGDSFQLINFSVQASQLGPTPLEATDKNIRRALRYLHSLNGEGGTMMIEGIKAALDFPHDPKRLRFVCFLTDGYIGNEAEILAAVHQRLGASRVFSFGIGSSVNRYLLEHMAKLGRGTVAYLGLHDSAAEIMEDFFDHISHPALTDIEIDWQGARMTEVVPKTIPDLFVGQPVIVTGRFQGTGNAPIRITGNAAGERVELAVEAPDHDSRPRSSLPQVWARMKIAELSDRSAYAPSHRLTEGIKRIALEYGLVSAFTAFIAVDSTGRTAGTEGTTVPVALPMPEGVKYETTVEE
jgi:Ca-activated chloride channel family protein